MVHSVGLAASSRVIQAVCSSIFWLLLATKMRQLPTDLAT
jgi:hypothetical protein